MMNPLYRRMFQQPGASRQPMGILASSPELANVAAQRQPVRMAQGGDVNLQTIMGELQQLQKQGDSVSLRRIASDPKFPDVVKRAASNLADSLRPDSVPLIQVGDVNLGNALSDATNRNPIGQSAGGKERSAAITPVGNVGDVNLSNALSDFSGRKPIGQSAGGQERSAKLRALPGRIAGGISDLVSDTAGGIADFFSSRVGAEPPKMGSVASPSFTTSGLRSGEIIPVTLPTASNQVGVSGLPLIGLGGTQSGSPSADVTADEQSELLRDPTTMLLDQLGSSRPYDETGADVNLGVNVTEIAKTPAEVLAEAKGTTTTPTQDAAAADAEKETKSANSSTANLAIKKISDNVANLQSGVLTQDNQKKLTDKEATNPDLLADFAPVIADFIPPEEVDLEAVDQRAKDLMGFDPKAAGEKKETAFWMGLMKAGLAMAAGESSNAITNIAKGLSFGLDAYGKDIADLNDQEREDRKEYRSLKAKMINDERSYNLSMAGAKNTHAQNQATIQNQFKRDKLDFGFKQADALRKERQNQATNAIALATLQNNAAFQIAKISQGDEQLDLSRDKLAATIEAARPDVQKIYIDAGYLDPDGKATQKGIDAFGSEMDLINRVATGAKTIKGPTDADKNAEALENAIKARAAGQSIDAADMSRLPKEIREDITLLDEMIKEGGVATKQAPTINTQAEYDALPSGSFFIQNGNRRQKP